MEIDTVTDSNGAYVNSHLIKERLDAEANSLENGIKTKQIEVLIYFLDQISLSQKENNSGETSISKNELYNMFPLFKSDGEYDAVVLGVVEELKRRGFYVNISETLVIDNSIEEFYYVSIDHPTPKEEVFQSKRRGFFGKIASDISLLLGL